MSYNLGQIEPDQRTELYADRREEEPQPRRLLATVMVLAVMGVFAGGLWFAYVEGTRHEGGTAASSDVPLIRADSHPDKVKPAQPGGMQIPDRNMLIYGEDRSMVEHLLPPPENPMPRPVLPPVPAETSPPLALPATAASAVPAPPPAIPAQTAAVAATAPSPPAAVPQTKSPPATAKREATRPLPARGGGVRLQLGSVRSEDLARSEWERIKRKNPDLLGELSASAIRADLGDKGVYYRIQTGPVGDLAAADRICGELKERNVGCILVR